MRLVAALELLGVNAAFAAGGKRGRLTDGVATVGRIYVREEWALLVFDVWLQHWLEKPLLLAVPESAGPSRLWRWIHEALGITPIPDLGLSDASLTLPRLTVDDRKQGAPTEIAAAHVGQWHSVICLNEIGDHYQQSSTQFLLRSGDDYFLWRCEGCGALRVTARWA